jgi:Tol biopolymer transport system component
MGAEGGIQTPLLADSSADIAYPSSCGKDYLVLTWAGHGGTKGNIWRTEADSSSPVKLTDGTDDMWPICSSDQKWVYYVDFAGHHVSRVPLDGSGKPEAIYDYPQGYIMGTSFSPDGKTLVTTLSGEWRTGEWSTRIALFDAGSSKLLRILDVKMKNNWLSRFVVQFTSDGKSIAYEIRENGVDNVWVQPLDGSPGHAITDFKSEQIWSFSLSPDGKSLAVLRGHYDSDVVLLQESKP